MLPTFGLTGMDAVTESALKSAFAEASMRMGGRWPLVSEQDATHVVVDMDSMYGPMSWLRLHGSGKVVIGLTTAARAQTDFRLGKPFTAESVAQLLQEIAPAEDGAPRGTTPAPVPADQLPEELPVVPSEERAAPDQRPSAAVAATLDTPIAPPAAPREAPSAAPPAPSAATPVLPPEPAPAPPPRDRTLVDWLAPGQLQGRVRLQRGGTDLLMDVARQQYFGPSTLKPLAAHVESVLGEGDFSPVDDAQWDRDIATLGQPQPLGRLLWFCALQAGKGELMPGFDPGARYRLSKWPQTEREFPKHFRIATAMMKGPATLEEITTACGVTSAEVADFVNANLATGYAEPYREPEPEPEQPKPSGLFGRLRGR